MVYRPIAARIVLHAVVEALFLAASERYLAYAVGSVRKKECALLERQFSTLEKIGVAKANRRLCAGLTSAVRAQSLRVAGSKKQLNIRINWNVRG